MRFFFTLLGADTVQNLMGRGPRKIGWVGLVAKPQPLEAGRTGEKFFGDRLGYPAISMNFKTESFTYVILLIFTHFVISLKLLTS